MKRASFVCAFWCGCACTFLLTCADVNFSPMSHFMFYCNVCKISVFATATTTTIATDAYTRSSSQFSCKLEDSFAICIVASLVLMQIRKYYILAYMQLQLLQYFFSSLENVLYFGKEKEKKGRNITDVELSAHAPFVVLHACMHVCLQNVPMLLQSFLLKI